MVAEAIRNLSEKFHQLDIKSLNISDNSKDYLLTYSGDFQFYMSMYSQLMDRALMKLKKPIHESTFVDYGGGSGLLSFLAREAGFRTVIYNDLYETRVREAGIISKMIHCSVDHYVCGDIENLITYLDQNGIEPDLICSFDVLEHIHDIESWIASLSKLTNEFILVFMTSANACNPVIASRLRRMQIRAEYYGGNNNMRTGDSFLANSFIEERQKIIRERFPGLGDDVIRQLAKKSRGLVIKDIERVVDGFIRTGELNYKLTHPTNTCDPYTGSWVEKTYNIKQLKELIQRNNLRVEFHNSFYAYSKNELINTIKFVLNLLITLSGHDTLILSPCFIMEVEKNK